MKQHTPGPWRIEGTNITEGSSGYIVSTADDRGPMPVAAIGLCNGPENEANGVLIAAAPELLASLEWALGQMEMDAFEPEFPEVKAEWDKAHEILTRVAGRAT